MRWAARRRRSPRGCRAGPRTAARGPAREAEVVEAVAGRLGVGTEGTFGRDVHDRGRDTQPDRVLVDGEPDVAGQHRSARDRRVRAVGQRVDLDRARGGRRVPDAAAPRGQPEAAGTRAGHDAGGKRGRQSGHVRAEGEPGGRREDVALGDRGDGPRVEESDRGCVGVHAAGELSRRGGAQRRDQRQGGEGPQSVHESAPVGGLVHGARYAARRQRTRFGQETGAAGRAVPQERPLRTFEGVSGAIAGVPAPPDPRASPWRGLGWVAPHRPTPCSSPCLDSSPPPPSPPP